MARAEMATDGGWRGGGKEEVEVEAHRGEEGHQTGGTAFASAFASPGRDSVAGDGAADAALEQEKGGAGGQVTERSSHSTGDGTARTHTSVFADFAEEGGHVNKDAGPTCESPTRAPIDLSQAGSMMHRLMEKDKSDVDPRDVHKLLPGQLLSSTSLDLNVDLLQKAIAMAAQTELQREQQAARAAGRPAAKGDEQSVSEGGEQDEPLSPASAPSFEVGGCVQSSPRPPSPPRARARPSRRPQRDAPSPVPMPPRMVSPIPGWPSPPPHMVPHMSPVLGMPPPFGGRPVTPPGMFIDQRMSPVPMPVPVSGPYGVMSPPPAVSMPGMPLPWGAYPPPQQQFGMPGMLPPGPPVHAVPFEVMPAGARPPKPVRVPMCGPVAPISACVSPPPVLHGRASVPDEMPRAATPINVRAQSATPEFCGTGSPNGGKDKGARRFRSVEAALAWCHVQHSQKQVPMVPKEDVKKLVEFQLSSGKPIRAPWYRPQKDEDEEEEVGSEGEAPALAPLPVPAPVPAPVLAPAPAPRELHQNVADSVAHAGQASPSPAKSPKRVAPLAPVDLDSCSDDEHDLAVAQIVANPPRHVAPLRTAPSRVKPSPAVAMPPMQQMVSSPPADAPVQSPSSTRMRDMMMNPGPARMMTTSPTRMSQMMTTPSPVRMSAGRMMPPQQKRRAPAAPIYRSATLPTDMMGYAHTPKRTGGRPGNASAMGRSRSGGHGTGFFIPAGMVLPA